MKKLCFSDILFFKKNQCIYTKKIYDLKIDFLSRNKFQINFNFIKNVSKFFKNIEQLDEIDFSFFISSSNYFFQKNVLDFYEQNINANVNINLLNEKKEQICLKEIKKEELTIKNKSYLLRSYLTNINYASLNNINLNRIEQYLFLMYLEHLDYFKFKSINIPVKTDLMLKIENYKNYENDFFSKLKKIEDVKKNKFSTLEFLLLISKVRKIELKYAFKRLYKEFQNFLNISDPFIGYFEIFNINDFYFKDEVILLQMIANKIENRKMFLKKIDVLDKKEQNSLLKTVGINEKRANLNLTEKERDILEIYFNIFLYKEDKKNAKIEINSKELKKDNLISLYYMVSYNNYFIPIEDFFSTLYHLLNRDFLLTDENYCSVVINPLLKNKLFFEDNAYYLNLKEILSKFKHFIFDEEEIFELPFFPLLKIKELSFECPVCKEKTYKIDYNFLFCSNNNCQFKFNRRNLSKQGIKLVNIKDIIKGLQLPSVYLENSFKEKKLYETKEYAPFKYSFTLKS